jgi:diguanylate cyclase (GGDEF)-like protein
MDRGTAVTDADRRMSVLPHLPEHPPAPSARMAPRPGAGGAEATTGHAELDDVRRTHMRLLAAIAAGRPLDLLLHDVVAAAEARAPGRVVTLLLLEEGDAGPVLRMGAAPGADPRWVAALDGAPVVPDAGGCLRAAHEGVPVATPDIQAEPTWAPWASLAADCGLRSCWSMPIQAAPGSPLLGVIAAYGAEVGGPTVHDWAALHELGQVAALGIERERSVGALAERDARSRAIIAALPNPTAVLDADGAIVAASRTWTDALAALRDHRLVEGEPYTAHLAMLAGRDDEVAGYAARQLGGLRAVLDGALPSFSLDRPVGSRWFSVRMATMPGGGAVVTYDDITQRRSAQDALADRAVRDPLTGLANRSRFTSALGPALRRSRPAHGEEIAVIFCDLDGFRHINDSLGHALGDEVIVQVAERLAAILPTNATLARFGGDEFTVLHEGVCGQLEAIGLAQHLAAVVAEPLVVGGHELFVTLSCGIAMAQPDSDAVRLLRDADVELRIVDLDVGGPAALRAGEGDVGVDRLEIAAGLRRAIREGELRLVYQPVVDLADGRVRSVEALVRWQHPVRGLLGPDAFIDVAEDTGLISGLGAWVLSAAVAQIAAWREGDLAIRVAVNLAARQLLDPDLPALVAEQLALHDVPASSLTVEITESMLLHDIDAGIATLEALAALGIRAAIDDFGTGFSSLAYLRRLPVDTVKIDRSFVAGLVDDSGDRAIVEAVIGLGRSFGLRVIAEGVETRAQRDALTALGCGAAQGYLFSRPVPPAGLPDVVGTVG